MVKHTQTIRRQIKGSKSSFSQKISQQITFVSLTWRQLTHVLLLD